MIGKNKLTMKLSFIVILASALGACSQQESMSTKSDSKPPEVTEENINFPAKNPWLTNSVYPTSHHNPGQTDASPINGPTHSQILEKKDVKTVMGLFNSQPVTKIMGEDRVLIAAGVLGVRKIFATGDAFEEIAFTPYPGFEELAKKTTDESLNNIIHKLDTAREAKDDADILALTEDMDKLGFSFRTVANGVYHFVDKDQFHYCVYGGVNLLKTTDNGKVKAPLEVVKSVNITEKLPPELGKTVNRIVGAGMTYNGNIAVAAPGMVALLNRDLDMLDYITFPGEFVDNSIAIDESGIYVVTSEYMYKLVWTGKELSFADKDGGWKSAYNTIDAETALKMGAASRGSGTTPALMGHGNDEDKLVIISDADRNGTNLTAFWRYDIPADFKQIPGTKSRRIAGQIRFEMSQLTAEASAVIKGYGAILANSTFEQPSKKRGDIVGNIFTAGVTRPAPVGLQKFEWDPKANKFSVAWTNRAIDNTDWMVPVVSKNNILYLPSKDGLAYEYVGLDWYTGKRIASWKMPTDSVFYNTSLGIAYFLEDGDLIFAGFFNTKRVNFSK